LGRRWLPAARSAPRSSILGQVTRALFFHTIVMPHIGLTIHAMTPESLFA
jgi:hypothetical protein